MTPEEVREANDLLRMLRDTEFDHPFGMGTSIHIDLGGRKVVIYLHEHEIGALEQVARDILGARRSAAMLRLRELGVELQSLTAPRKLGPTTGSESLHGDT